MTVPSKFLCLLLLLSCVRAAPRHAHCLCLNITVLSQPGPQQPQNQYLGSLDAKLCQYDSDCIEVRLLGPLGEKVNGTNALNKIPPTLGELMKSLRMILAEMKIEGPVTLWLWCLQEAGRCTGAFVKVIFKGKPVLLYDAIKDTWPDINSTAGGTQENWEGIKELAEDFRKISVGDCSHWLREFLEHMEKVQEPTELNNPQGPLAEKVNATNAWTELPQTQGERAREHLMNLSDISLEKNRTRDTLQPSTAWSAQLIIGIAFPVIISILIVPGIIYFVQKRRRTGAMKAVPSSDASSLDHDTVSELNGTLMTETDVDDNDTNLAGNLTYHPLCRSGLSRNP